MIGVVLIAVGLVGLGWGMATALRAPRPASVGAALVAAAGLALALAGAARLLVPGFFG